MSTSARPRSASTSAVLLVGALLAAAGCTGADEPDGAASTSQTGAAPSPSVETSQAAARRQAEAAYTGYLQAFAVASQQADPDNQDLARYAADPLLSLPRHNLRALQNKGAVQLGAQRATVLGATVDLDSAQPSVTLQSCLDYSSITLVYRTNQSPVPNSAPQSSRVSAVVTVWRYQNGQWLVNDTKQGSGSC